VALLEVENLTKTFGGIMALSHVSLSIEKGTLVGIIGPNGSGKTTLLGLAAGLLVPTSGTARIFGRSCRQASARTRLGYVPEAPALQPRMRVSELLELCGRLSGLSTAETISRISGRGVGMDAVRAVIESLGGSVELATEAGVGTTIALLVPITAAVQRVLLVGASGETIAIPIRKVERILEVSAREIEHSGRESFALIDDEPVPVLELAERLALARPAADSPDETITLVLSEVRGERVALRVERVAGQQQIYVKPVPALLSAVRALVGLTILGDGRPVFLLDLNQLA